MKTAFPGERIREKTARAEATALEATTPLHEVRSFRAYLTTDDSPGQTQENIPTHTPVEVIKLGTSYVDGNLRGLSTLR